MSETPLDRLRRFDAQRTQIPGEHWLALGAGVSTWLLTRRHPKLFIRLLGSIAGTLLVVRATTGTEVPGALRKLPFASRRPSRVHEWVA